MTDCKQTFNNFISSNKPYNTEGKMNGSDVVFEIVDPYNMKGRGIDPSQSFITESFTKDELFSVMCDVGDGQYDKEIDVYALVPDMSDEVDDVDVDSLYKLLEERRNKIVPNVKITPLSVSTQSAKASMSQALDLKHMATIFMRLVNKNIEEEDDTHSIKGVIYKDIYAGDIKKPKEGQFPNNCSVLIRSPMGTGRKINIKIFRGGKMTMTGCLIKEDGIAVIKILEQYLKKQKELFGCEEERKRFKISNFETTMVNSGYNLGFEVDRERLYDFLTTETELNVSYSPATYAGVKIYFYFNTVNKVNDGICRCPGSPCTGDKSNAGKGSGNKLGQCKRVTIAIFESGNVIDTGGRNMEQALTAYNYINAIIRENAKKFVKINIQDILDQE